MKNFFGISDAERMKFEGDWSRSSKRTDILHAIIEEDIRNRNNSILIEKEKLVDYSNGYKRKHDFSLEKDNKILEVKFIEKDLEKNINNYFESEFGRACLVENCGKEFYSLTFVRSSAVNSKKTNVKDMFKKYNNFKNCCVMYYDDNTQKYEVVAGKDYDDFIDSIAK